MSISNIKFRAKPANGETDKWIQGSLVIGFTGIPFMVTMYDHILGVSSMFEVQEGTVGQYTGIGDKDKKELYDGDIVSDETTIYKIWWNTTNGCWWLEAVKSIGNKEVWAVMILSGGKLGNGYYHRQDLTLLGNIHDNPELLQD